MTAAAGGTAPGFREERGQEEMGAEGQGERETGADAGVPEEMAGALVAARWMCFLPLRWRASDWSSVRCSTSWQVSQVAQVGPPRLDGKEKVKWQRCSAGARAGSSSGREAAGSAAWPGEGEARRAERRVVASDCSFSSACIMMETCGVHNEAGAVCNSKGEFKRQARAGVAERAPASEGCAGALRGGGESVQAGRGRGVKTRHCQLLDYK